jgi:hypothetical protein
LREYTKAPKGTALLPFLVTQALESISRDTLESAVTNDTQPIDDLSFIGGKPLPETLSADVPAIARNGEQSLSEFGVEKALSIEIRWALSTFEVCRPVDPPYRARLRAYAREWMTKSPGPRRAHDRHGAIVTP